MFYDFRQNNSGGYFDIEPDAGISVHVIVEADSHWEANARAREIGLYFDGYGDCPCCGDRWSEQWSDDGDSVPSVYGIPATEVTVTYPWARAQPEAFIHYKDGRMEALWAEKDGSTRLTPWPYIEAQVIDGEPAAIAA